jgi:hypothetical protein
VLFLYSALLWYLTAVSLWQVWLSAGARTQLIVDLVNMRQEAARGGQKVHLRGVRANMFFLRIQLAVDLVNMRQEVVRGRQKVQVRGIPANIYPYLFGHSWQ